MITYTAKRRNKDMTLREEEYPIYESEEEFREYQPDATLTYWKDAPKGYEGGWLLDDDGYISPCRYVEEFLDKLGRTRKKVRFQWAGFYPSKKNVVGFKSTPKHPWSRSTVNRSRFRIIAKSIARMAVDGHKPTEAQLEAFGKFYRSDQKIPKATIKRILRTKDAQNMIADEIAILLQSKGISTDQVIDDYQTIKQAAIDRGQLGVAKGVVDTYRDMLGMMPNKTSVETETTMEMSVEELYSKMDNQRQIVGTTNGLLRHRADESEDGSPGEEDLSS